MMDLLIRLLDMIDNDENLYNYDGTFINYIPEDIVDLDNRTDLLIRYRRSNNIYSGDKVVGMNVEVQLQTFYSVDFSLGNVSSDKVRHNLVNFLESNGFSVGVIDMEVDPNTKQFSDVIVASSVVMWGEDNE